MKGIKATVINELRAMGIRKADKFGVGSVALRQHKTNDLCRLLAEERAKEKSIIIMAAYKKCCVCGEESNITMFSTGHNLLDYCEHCALNYLENYNEMVNIGMFSYELSPSYRQKTLIPSLTYYKETLRDFDRDVLSFLNDSEDEDDKDE